MLVIGMNVMATETLELLLENIKPLSQTETFDTTVSMVEDATKSFSSIHLLEGAVLINRSAWEYFTRDEKENLIFAYICYMYAKVGNTDLKVYVDKILVFHSYNNRLLSARIY